MPKTVDVTERRTAVVDAVLRLAAREGLRRVSLRTVADEAGLNIGSVRHYFDGQGELMTFALRSLSERVMERVRRRRDEIAAAVAPTPEERLEQRVALLGELLPLDEARRDETTVYLEFLVAARTDPLLAPLAREAQASVTTLAQVMLRRMDEAGGLVPCDLDVEAQRLAALVDGLGLHCVLHPELTSGADCLDALRAHLAALAPAPVPA